MISKILLFISGGLLTIGGYLGLVGPKEPLIVNAPFNKEEIRLYVEDLIDQKLAVLPNRDVFGAPVEPVAGATFNLSGSGVAASTSVITLQSLTIPQTGQVLVDGDFSDTFYLTLEPGSRSRQEIVSCTTVVQNSGGTATLSGCSRGLSPITPFTASTTLRFAHGGGTQVIFSDPPQLFNQFAAKTNDESISGLFNFGTSPVIGTATSGPQAASRTYVDNASFAGAGTSSFTGGGLSQLAKNEQLAAGTASSSVTDGRPLVLAALYSTSTPGVNITLVGGAGEFFIPITETDGKLNPDFLDFSENWEFTSATSTFSNGTTTIMSRRFSVGTTTPPGGFNGITFASSTYIDNGGLGVGRATTTDNNVEIGGELMLWGKILAPWFRKGIIATSTNSAGSATSDGSRTTVVATCPEGMIALSGGFISSGGDYFTMDQSWPSASTTWTVRGICNRSGGSCSAGTLRAHVLCIQD